MSVVERVYLGLRAFEYLAAGENFRRGSRERRLTALKQRLSAGSRAKRCMRIDRSKWGYVPIACDSGASRVMKHRTRFDFHAETVRSPHLGNKRFGDD